MRRSISLFMIALLVSITSLPMLPKAAVCHAAEANVACEPCHPQESTAIGTAHDMHADMMHGSGMEMQHSMEQPKEMHKHQKQLSAAEKNCRIECGCGCNHSADGLPNLLSPHVSSTSEFKMNKPTARIEPTTLPALHTFVSSDPSPPPKLT